MNRWIRIVVVALVAGLGAFAITRSLAPAAPVSSEIAWLISEFNLSKKQAVEIQALHEAYDPICASHCASILTTRQKLASVTAPHVRLATEGELADLIATCHQSTAAHLHAVAAAMSPDQGQRYLKLISPRLSAHQHAEPFGLR